MKKHFFNYAMIIVGFVWILSFYPKVLQFLTEDSSQTFLNWVCLVIATSAFIYSVSLRKRNVFYSNTTFVFAFAVTLGFLIHFRTEHNILGITIFYVMGVIDVLVFLFWSMGILDATAEKIWMSKPLSPIRLVHYLLTDFIPGVWDARCH